MIRHTRNTLASAFATSIMFVVLGMPRAATTSSAVGFTPSVAARATIRGTVTDVSDGNPLRGANVAVVGTGLDVLTDRDGTYEISGVPRGTYDLQASLVGYTVVTVTGVKIKRQTTELHADFQLPERAARLTTKRRQN